MTELQRRAGELRDLHRPGDPLVLVNAWDAASATAVAAIGARAIGTSSAAMAASLGVPDGRDAPLDAVFDAVARIVNAVDVPVTADLLDGYGLGGDALVDRLLTAGAVGCNIEDSDHLHPGLLLDAEVVATRLSDVRAAASRAGVDVVLNARIDCLLHVSDPAEGITEVVERGRCYIEAGADCVFPVRLTDPRLARAVVDGVGGRVNAGWSPVGSIVDLIAAGVHRVSVGPQAHRSTLAALDDFARPLISR
jgi:2-methylisocitrate lyase-like PEP mutase family enzyme